MQMVTIDGDCIYPAMACIQVPVRSCTVCPVFQKHPSDRGTVFFVHFANIIPSSRPLDAALYYYKILYMLPRSENNGAELHDKASHQWI